MPELQEPLKMNCTQYSKNKTTMPTVNKWKFRSMKIFSKGMLFRVL
jgi:hypothetical protein